MVKAKSYETLAKRTIAKLLYGRSDAEGSDYKTNRKLEKKHVNIDVHTQSN